MTQALVDVEPATVLRVGDELRRASRLYGAAGWRISTSVPLMPPLFLARTQVTLDIVAARLQALAVEMELDGVAVKRQMARLTMAGSGSLASTIHTLWTDLADEAREAWGELLREPGPQAWTDPIGGNVHLAAGVADNLAQMYQTAERFGHLTPNYALVDPVGAARARQEVMAMLLNLVLLFPETALLDPEGHRRAVSSTAAKMSDWNDLEHGDLPRWVGHIGSGLALAELLRIVPPPDDAAPATGTALDGTAEGPGGALRASFEALGHANRLPTDTGGSGRSERNRGRLRNPGVAGSVMESDKGR